VDCSVLGFVLRAFYSLVSGASMVVCEYEKCNEYENEGAAVSVSNFYRPTPYLVINVKPGSHPSLPRWVAVIT